MFLSLSVVALADRRGPSSCGIREKRCRKKGLGFDVRSLN